MTVEEALGALETSPKGLPRDEADRRRDEHGPNELSGEFHVSKILTFLKQFRDVFVILLIIAAGISYAIGSFRDGSVMLAIVVVNAVIGFIQEYKAGKIVESLRNLIRSPARVVVGGELSEIPQHQLVPGDIVRVEAGDKIPADMRIIESFNLRTNDFSLTGESTPQGKHTNAVREEAVLADRDNMAYLGTTVASGTATGVVTATGMETEMGKIAGMTQATREIPSPLERELSSLANRLTVVVIVISATLFGVALWQGFSLYTSLIYALGIAVAMVPQALPAQVTVALSSTSKLLAERNAVVKNLPSVETLGSTTVICTDKTGTLTKNEMTVQKVWFDGEHHELTGLGYEPEGEILGEDGQALSKEEIDEIEVLMDAATMASNAEIHEPDEDHPTWYAVGDPTEAALVTMSTKLGTRSPREDEENPELHEFPFDSERKRMSSVRQFGDRVELAMKGATDSVLAISKSIYKDGEVRPITDEDRERIRRINEEYSNQALRVLAIAFRPLDEQGRDYDIEEVEKDVTFLGLVGMIDPPKEGVREAVAECRKAHIRTFIMTGDHAITAQAVGREIGLFEPDDPAPVITGRELGGIEDEELAKTMADNRAIIFSRVAPEDKLRIVDLLSNRGEVVAVTGDGVNDAPALKRADIGVAMGQIGTDVAKEASELVLLDDSFPTLVEAVRQGRTIYANIRKIVLASLTTNGAELFVVLFGLAAAALQDWAIGILAIQILAIDLLAEILPLTSLTFDPPNEAMMSSRPRDLDDHILNRSTAPEVAWLGLLIGGLAFVNYVLFMVRENTFFMTDVGRNAMYARGTTLAYLTIAYCQFANILSRRYERTTVFNRNFWTNRPMLISVAASIVMTSVAVYAPGISDFLFFEGPTAADWVYILGAGLLYLGVFEAMKAVKRRRPAAAPYAARKE
ncbi:MAG: HAD-IC family P-type ATPase [Candidatus Eisenbacteria bacterium]|nr:HAD-IC family P-type ATPase [Candidatus Eisenbacteria bacterium]